MLLYAFIIAAAIYLRRRSRASAAATLGAMMIFAASHCAIYHLSAEAAIAATGRLATTEFTGELIITF